MKIIQLILLVVFLLPQIILAETDADFEKYMEYQNAEFKKAEREIPKIIEKYATAIGCEFLMDPNNVVPFRIGKNDGYLAIYSLDLGCSGGSNMSMTYFAFLQKGYPFHILINPAYSNPSQSPDQFPRHEAKIFLKDGELWYSGFIPDYSKDALCCASIPTKGKVIFNKGKWEVTPE